jgi:hypothetical protein
VPTSTGGSQSISSSEVINVSCNGITEELALYLADSLHISKTLNPFDISLHLLIQDKEDGINETVNTHGELFNGFFWFLLAEDVDSKIHVVFFIDHFLTIFFSFYIVNISCLNAIFLMSFMTPNNKQNETFNIYGFKSLILEISLNINGYVQEREDRTENCGGGWLAYISENLEYTRKLDLERSNIETIWFEIKP